MEIINGILTAAFWSVSTIIVTIVTGFVNQVFLLKADWAKRLVSWALSIGLSAGAWFVGLVKFDEPTPVWLGIAVLGLITGLASNGIYSIKAIKDWVATWFVENK